MDVSALGRYRVNAGSGELDSVGKGTVPFAVTIWDVAKGLLSLGLCMVHTRILTTVHAQIASFALGIATRFLARC
jgi:hypothetical protein